MGYSAGRPVYIYFDMLRNSIFYTDFISSFYWYNLSLCLQFSDGYNVTQALSMAVMNSDTEDITRAVRLLFACALDSLTGPDTACSSFANLIATCVKVRDSFTSNVVCSMYLSFVRNIRFNLC